MNDYHELVLRLRNSEWQVDQDAAAAIERLQAERDRLLAVVNLERVNHREEMDALRRVAERAR